MDSARQIIRWSIPGSLLLLSICGAYIALRLCLGQSLESALAPIRKNVSPATGIALAVPLGFLGYQFYEWTYRPTRLFGVVSANRGAKILSYLTHTQLSTIKAAIPGTVAKPWTQVRPNDDFALAAAGHGALVLDAFEPPATRFLGAKPKGLQHGRLLPIKRAFRWTVRLTRWQELQPLGANGKASDSWGSRELRRIVKRLYRARWETHFTLASVLLDVSSMGERNAEIKEQWRNVNDIYHSVGASRLAIGVGTALGIVVHYLQVAVGHGEAPKPSTAAAIASTGGVVVACFGLILVLNQVRAKAFERSAERLGYGLRVAFAREPELLDHLRDRGTAFAPLPSSGPTPTAQSEPEPIA